MVFLEQLNSFIELKIFKAIVFRMLQIYTNKTNKKKRIDTNQPSQSYDANLFFNESQSSFLVFFENGDKINPIAQT